VIDDEVGPILLLFPVLGQSVQLFH
jgi:hypothetical protein